MHNISSPTEKNTAIIIVAAGRGQRAGDGLPKQYRKIGGEMVLKRTLRAFANFCKILVLIHPDDEDLFKQAFGGLDFEIIQAFGGKTRTLSVKNGLEALKADPPDFVLIHDAARPFISQAVIKQVLDGLNQYQAVAPSLPIVDAIKTSDGQSVDRDALKRVQTPQGFHFHNLVQAFDKLDTYNYADDIEVAKQAGLSIGFSKGEERNKKLTYESDFMVEMINITGSGFDVHRICDGKTLTLCGVEIEAGFALKGHSDADVGLHALTDALLGTIAAGDIGTHFPPSDSKWKGAKSDIFLAHAAQLIGKKGGIIDHIDITIICEQPKITPFREAMRNKIASILDIPTSRISLKATTTEGLGYTGRGEGIAAQAIANIRLVNV